MPYLMFEIFVFCNLLFHFAFFFKATPFPNSFKCFTCENAGDNYNCNRWAEDKWCPQSKCAEFGRLLWSHFFWISPDLMTYFRNQMYFFLRLSEHQTILRVLGSWCQSLKLKLSTLRKSFLNVIYQGEHIDHNID